LRIDLSFICGFSALRALWADEPNPPGCGLCSKQHRGGRRRITKGEFIQSIGHARGSLLEIETQLIVAKRFGYLGTNETDALLEVTTEIGKVVNGLIRSLK
jgi:four helix bundle protein